MTKLIINIPDDVARELIAEANLRQLSVEQVAAERVGASVTSENRKPTPARPPLRLDDPEAVIGSFANRPDLLDGLENVINDRVQRYLGPK